MSESGKNDLSSLLFGLLALALPAGLFLVHDGLGHQGDMRFFFDWFQAFRRGPDFYAAGPGLNYPILGVFLVCGPAWLVERLTGVQLEFETFRLVLKLSLVLAEVGLILALAVLARTAGALRPRLLALALFALPATWGGGAWFGQIDLWGSLLLVLAFAGLGRFAQRAGAGKLAAGSLALGVLCAVCALLTKQLVLFSLPVLGLLWALGLARLFGAKRRLAAAALGLGSLACLGLIFLPDLWLQLPSGWSSHLAFVLFGGGSDHGLALSGNGANIWANLDFPPGTTAHVPLWLGLEAWSAGLLFFGLACALFGVLWVRALGAGRELLPESLLLAGLVNLAMVTLLTGVHERYFVHGSLFLLLGLETRGWGFFARGLPGRLGRLGWITAGWSGLFVLASIHYEVFVGPLRIFRSPRWLGWLELGLLLALAAAWLVQGRPGTGEEA